MKWRRRLAGVAVLSRDLIADCCCFSDPGVKLKELIEYEITGMA